MTEQPPASTTARIATALVGRRWTIFVAELLLIVIGILVALTIDGWVEDRENRQLEQNYLSVLIRDLDQMHEQLQAYVVFESAVSQSGSEVITILASSEGAEQATELRTKLSNMAQRRTLRLVSAGYLDLTSTGRLQLIRDQELRDQILRFFAELGRIELIIEKNNTVFVDNLYFPFLMDRGVTWSPGSTNPLGAALKDLNQRVLERLGPGFEEEMDSVFHDSADSEFWDDLRRITLNRMLVAEAGKLLAESLADATLELKSTIELQRRQ